VPSHFNWPLRAEKIISMQALQGNKGNRISSLQLALPLDDSLNWPGQFNWPYLTISKLSPPCIPAINHLFLFKIDTYNILNTYIGGTSRKVAGSIPDGIIGIFH